ncbi:hypothetical protein [Actinoplanes regularis]|nr:hypothetical protein [Actinoplanes regularis]GIE85237.1 hypothetical protein Are01nite_17170 [Actinoplanes regularis]
MIGFDAGFIPQLLCVADTTPTGLAGALCVLVVSAVVGIGFWQASEPRRVSVGRSMCLGTVLGFVTHCVFVAVFRLS